MNNGTKLSLGILGGLGAGFCLGLLMAPDKGSNSRKRIAEATGDWALKLKNMFSSNGHHKTVGKRSTGRSAGNANHMTRTKRNHS